MQLQPHRKTGAEGPSSHEEIGKKLKKENASSQERRIYPLLNRGAILAATLLLTSGCVVTSDDPPPNQNSSEPTSSTSENPPSNNSEQEIIASSVTSSTAIGSNYRIDIYALERVGNSLLRLSFGVTNNSESSYFFDDGLSGTENPYTGDRITLLDPENRTRHLSIEESDGSCFCSVLNEDIPANGTAEMWVVFPEPPEGVDAMTITTPITPPLLDIPISNSSETVENTGLSDPEIIPLTMISDDTEDNTGRTESGDEVSIILSSDVLFETDSAELSSDAQEILDQVASEIENAESSEVNIDGYADNTGSDSVNIPLSQERAEAVESTLAELISREGITFNVEGHGSADPIGDNDTEEGRERNRRVSVTFEN